MANVENETGSDEEDNHPDDYFQDSPKYVIVEFPEEKEEDGTVPVSVVSSTWLTVKNRYTYCLWPSYFKSDSQRLKAVEKHEMPITERCQENLVNEKYRSSNYQKAIRKLKRLEEGEESVSESEIEAYCLTKRKRKHPRFLEEFVDKNMSSEDEVPLAPKIQSRSSNLTPSQCSESYNKKPSGRKQQFSSSPSMGTINRGSPVAGPVVHRNNLSRDSPSTSTNSRSSSPSSLRINNRGSPITKVPVYRNSLSRDSPLETSSISANSQKECSCNINKKILEELVRDVKAIKRDIRTLNENPVVVNNNNITKNVLELPDPVNSKNQLLELDNRLSDLREMETMVSSLQTLGGKDITDTTRRILNQILSHDLALQYNWTGKNNKGSFMDLKNIMTLITVTIRKNRICEKATREEVEKAMKGWLRNAPDRNGGRSKRKIHPE